MQKGIKRFIGDKAFYAMVFAVAVPIMIQNGITNFVSLLDNIMVGQIGTEQMSGVSIVNQLIFIFNLATFGAVSGAGIFTAQFHGKDDNDGVVQTFRFKLMTVVLLALVAIGIFAAFSDELIGLYLNDGSVEGDLELTLAFGKQYIAIMLWGLVPFAISQAYGGTLRETGHTVLPMVAGFAAVGVNGIGNYLLIYGKFGCPELGVEGAAIASVISRFVELAILLIATHTDKTITCKNGLYRRFFHIDKALAKNILVKGSPLFINELFWSLGSSALAYCYSLRGLDVVAGYSISSTVINCFSIAYIALGNSVGIIVGKYLGAGQTELAEEYDVKLIAFAVVMGGFMGAILAATSGLFPQVYNTTAETKQIAASFLLITGCIMPMHGFLHSCYFTLRSGGKTLITLLYDSGFVCLVNVPIAFCLAKFTELDVRWIYLAANGVEVFKSLLGYVMLKRKIWVNKIV